MRLVTVGNLDPYATLGGYERVWRAAVGHWRAAGHRVEVVSGFELDVRDGRWRRPSRLRDARNRRAVRAALEGAEAVAWFGMGGLSLSLLDEAAGLPQLAVVHDGWPVYGRGEPREVPGEWTFNSAYTRDRVLAAGWRPAAASVVHPGVDLEAFGFVAPDGWRGRLACVGRVEEAKGVAVAASASSCSP